LIDELGGLARAVEIAREKAGIKPHEAHELVPYPSPSLISALNLSLTRSEMSWTYSLGAELAGVPARWLPAVMRLMARGGLMLLSPISQ
jgi:hypothetical protein